MDTLKIIEHFYPGDTALRRMLLQHSAQVRDKALAIANTPVCRRMKLNLELLADGAMLHDIGIIRCHAPGIFCEGTAAYIAHGIIGAQMLRNYDPSLEAYARICERHTGSGLSAQEIRAQSLPLPERDYLPETPEEKLLCLADKFYSKSGDMREKTTEHIRRGLRKFGPESLERFDILCALFGVNA